MSKYYHCSGHQFNTGDVVTPAKGCGVMFMGDAPAPHKTIPHAYHWGWYVYEVSPIGQLWYGTDYHELMAASAVIVQCLGKAEDLFPDKELSTVRLSAHPGAIPVTDCDYVGCESPLGFFLSHAFSMYEQGEDDYLPFLETAVLLSEGKDELIEGDPKYYLDRFDPLFKPFFGPPG